MNCDFGRNARNEMHRNAAFSFALPDASREFDPADFEVDNFAGIFDRDFHEILFPIFKKRREIFGRLEFQPKIRAMAISTCEASRSPTQ
jgi:hypothetical protein